MCGTYYRSAWKTSLNTNAYIYLWVNFNAKLPILFYIVCTSSQPQCPWSTARHTRGSTRRQAYTRIHEAQRRNYTRRILYVSCHGPLPRRAQRMGIHIKTIRYWRMVDSRGSPYAALYARRILVDPGRDSLDTWRLECFLFLFTRGWFLVDPDVREENPVQWITGIMFHVPNDCGTPRGPLPPGVFTLYLALETGACGLTATTALVVSRASRPCPGVPISETILRPNEMWRHHNKGDPRGKVPTPFQTHLDEEKYGFRFAPPRWQNNWRFRLCYVSLLQIIIYIYNLYNL